jgi:hypothetical protein
MVYKPKLALFNFNGVYYQLNAFSTLELQYHTYNFESAVFEEVFCSNKEPNILCFYSQQEIGEFAEKCNILIGSTYGMV